MLERLVHSLAGQGRIKSSRVALWLSRALLTYKSTSGVFPGPTLDMFVKIGVVAALSASILFPIA